ncbi:Slam-dependent surface lipoprotein [Neisseria sicca]|uniref:Slam-dependent surface lipoprotein n=1 Tax=Neisseria sicca TaxID=490 RepID=UPI001ADDCB26|nr:Slam-dependent surface lipoprotein [Neisseria sicca]QTM22138.1 hemoglobin-haptoglobin-utilization protein [Neisseria sicca]
MKIKVPAISAAATLILTACAGGGASEPKVPVAIPTAQPIANVKLSDESSAIKTINTLSGKGGSLHEAELEVKTSWGTSYTDKQYVYQTPSGNYYNISSYSDPIIPSYSSPSYNLRTRHEGQPLSEGGKLFVCCSNSGQSTYVPVTKHDHLKFGAWISSDGTADLFVGGKPVGIVKDATVEQNTAKGKTTYEVWAVRVRNGNIVTSTYDPGKSSGLSEKTAPKLSLLTANFNTNKLGGTILGNADYGPDVVMKDVGINGVDFSGTAESDGKNGKVEGKFFGQFNSGYKTEVSIGGKVTFDADKSLDTVFGGVENSSDRNTTDTSLTPVSK